MREKDILDKNNQENQDKMKNTYEKKIANFDKIIVQLTQ